MLSAILVPLMDQLGEKAEADDETILNQSGSAEDNTTETGSSGPLRLRLSAHGLALPVIQDVAAQLSLFGGVDLTPENVSNSPWR